MRVDKIKIGIKKPDNQLLVLDCQVLENLSG